MSRSNLFSFFLFFFFGCCNREYEIYGLQRIVPSMCTLHHTPHEPPSHITYPTLSTLPNKIEHNLERRRVPRMLLQPLLP